MYHQNLTEIKKTIENQIFQSSQNQNYSNFNAIPQEELAIISKSFSFLDKTLAKFDILRTGLNKNEIQKWSLIYLALHNLLHQENNEVNDLTKLEIYSTAPIFLYAQNLLEKNEQEKLIYAYFILGSNSLKIDHSLPHLISEKLILGEFIAFGGIEESLWGYKLKTDLMLQISQNILEKTNKDRINHLIAKYKNFVPHFL